MHKHFPKYAQSLVGNARRLRREMTDPERKLWNVLRNNQAGVKFRRQVPLGKYILDFYCHSIKLNVELDGSQHYTEEGRRKDGERDRWLQNNGIEAVRFSDADVFKNIDGVGQVIYEKIQERLRMRPHLSSSPKRGGESNSLSS